MSPNEQYETVFGDTEGIDKLRKELDNAAKKRDSEITRRSKGRSDFETDIIRRNLTAHWESKTSNMVRALDTLLTERHNQLDSLAQIVEHKPQGKPLRILKRISKTDFDHTPDPMGYARAALEPLNACFKRLGYKSKVVLTGDHTFALYADSYAWILDVVERLRSIDAARFPIGAIVFDVRAIKELETEVDLRVLYPSVTDEQWDAVWRHIEAGTEV